MARIIKLPKFNKGDGICVYFMNGNLYMRSSSSLTASRVKTSPEFKNTMINAGLLAKASKIGSMIYQSLPLKKRKHHHYRSLTGRAMKLLKSGVTEKAAMELLRG